MKTKDSYKIIVIGAGTAGLSFTAHLLRNVSLFKESIAIIDPSKKHYFQPLWSLVGGGIVSKESTMRDQESLVPNGAIWIPKRVVKLFPSENKVLLDDETMLEYEILIVAAGIQINWGGIKGLKESIGTNGVCSNYSYKYVDSTWREIERFKGGNAVFTHPNTPIKCGGAPQKIMYLAEEHFCNSEVRKNSEVMFYSANPNIFQVPRYADTLDKVLKRKQIITNYNKNLVEIIAEKREAIFEDTQTLKKESVSYSMLHVVPPMGPPSFIKDSEISDHQGWVDIDPYTLQHVRYKNIFGLGDCTNLPTSKTGAAIRKQVPVLKQNIMDVLNGRDMQAKYDGYTSCPIVTGYKSLILAEFNYEHEPQETFPFNQAEERYSMFLLKRYMLPYMYWNFMLKGIL
ncbi:FAD/NAD(P)-binding oxidoreductase [Bacillus mycoides]|uniref:NAD(P)/FAD-dependent oxidoreductase n=1 Tax=Bacillus mycoides TaxID=1405 RepID=UPI003D647EE6